MRKVIKISIKVLSAIILLLMIIPLSAALLLNVEGVQTYVVRKASEAVSESFGTTVTMERISIRGFNRVAVKGFYVEDFAGDTLIYAHELSAQISKTAILRNEILLGGIKLDSGKVYLYQPKSGNLNIQDIVTKLLGDHKQGTGTKIALRNIDITNVSFKYQKEGEESKVVEGINYGNMILDGVNASSENLVIDGKKVTMDLHDVSFTEISGFEAEDMSVGLFTINDGLLDFDDTRIKTPLSELHVPRIVIKGESWKSFKDFVNKVKLEVVFDKSELHSKTLSYFIPRLAHAADIPLTNVKLTFAGTVNDFGGRIANITSNGTRFEGDYSVKNVRPAVDSAWFTVDIKHLTTDCHGVESIMAELSAGQLAPSVAGMLRRAGQLDMTGRMDGRLRDFDASLNINSPLGGAVIAAGIERGGEGTQFDGDAKIDRFDIGQLLGNTMLGRVSADIEAKGALHDGNIDAEGNAAIPALEFNGYTYGDILVNGGFRDNIASGRIDAGDDNLKFTLTGRADIRKDIVPQYDIALDLKRADLHRLGVNRRDSVALISGILAVNGSGNSLDNLNGTVNIDDLTYVSPADSVRTGGIVFTGRNSEDSKYMAFNAPFMDAEFVSSMSYGSIMDYLEHIIYKYIPALEKESGNAAARHEASVAEEGAPESNYGTSRMTLNVKQANNVAEIFLPGLSIAEDSYAELSFTPNTERLSIKAHSNFIEYDKFLVTKLDLMGDNYTKSDSLNMVFTTDELIFPGFSLPSSSISTQASNNNARVTAQISNREHEFCLSLDMAAGFGRDDKGGLTVDAHFLPSNMTTGARVWSISDEHILYSTDGIAINNFRITEGRQGLLVDGVVSANGTDTLTVSLDDLTIAPLSGFTDRLGYTVDGTVRGKVAVSSAMRRPLIDGEVMFENMKVNGIEVIPLRLGSRWDFQAQRASLFIHDINSGQDIVRGFYRPSDGAYMGNVNIAGLPFSALDPLLAGAVKTSDGKVDIDVEIRSTPHGNTPILKGSVRLRDLETTVAFNKATYSLEDADIRIADNIVSLKNITVLDSEGNRAALKADADLSNFSAIRYNASLTPNNIIVLNTGSNDNETFYGKLYASGLINVKGDKMGVNIDITATTGNNSSFFMPLSGGSSIGNADFLVFESKRSRAVTDEGVISQRKRVFEKAQKEGNGIRSNVNINMALNVLPNTSVTLLLDREQSNVINARGTASLNMAVNPTNNMFSMYGNYEISEGDYTMNILDLNTTKLEIQPGGNIQWTGDPANAILDISALYRLRTSPDGLFAAPDGSIDPDDAVGRVPIECLLGITGRLSQPEFAFSINAPTIYADQQSKLAAALSAEGMVELQFMYLVALGSFYVGDTATQSLGASTASAGIGLLTNMFSNLISTDKTRFTLGYSAQDAYSSSEVDIGFSTDIISDRLSLDFETNFNTMDNKADVGNNGDYGINDIMDYNATITGVLNKAGNLKAKAFTRVIDRFENRGMQETGVGVYYREDFDKISDIWQNAKERRARRRQAREEKKKLTTDAVSDSRGSKLPLPSREGVVDSRVASGELKMPSTARRP